MSLLIYDTRALTEQQWAVEKESLLRDGWEYRLPLGGVVYVRKHLDGELNTEKGWLR